MSWLSNHSLNAILTGASALHRLRRRCHDDDLCQDAACLNSLLRDQDAWGGVYAADTLPPSPPSQSCYIVNSAPASSRGEHWLAVRVLPNCVEFFDSYGQPPWCYPLIYAWLQGLRKARILYLRQRIQGPRAYCGAYCFYLLSERPFSRSLYATLFDHPRYVFTSLDASTEDPALIQRFLSPNDTMVFDYLYRHTQTLLSVFDDHAIKPC